MQKAALPSEVVDQLAGVDEAGKAIKPHLRLNVERKAPVAPEEDDDDDDDNEDEDESEVDADAEGAEEQDKQEETEKQEANQKPVAAAAAIAAAAGPAEPTTREMLQRVRQMKPTFRDTAVHVQRKPEIEAARAMLPILREEFQVRHSCDLFAYRRADYCHLPLPSR